MARYFAYTSPARGHLHALVPSLLELQARGQEVHLRTLAAEVRSLEGAGPRAAPIAPAIEELPLADWQTEAPDAQLEVALRSLMQRAAQ